MWYWVNPFPNNPWFLRVCSTSLLKTLGKGEIAHNELFPLFLQRFLSVWWTFCHFHKIWNLSSANSFSLEEPKFFVWERVKLLPGDKILILSQSKVFQTTDVLWLYCYNFSFKQWKTLLEKEKMLVTSIFFFSSNVLKRLFPKGNQMSLSWGKGLILIHVFTCLDVQVFWKHCENEKLLVTSNFSFFPPVFSIHLENSLPFSSNSKLLSAYSFGLEGSKIWRFG